MNSMMKLLVVLAVILLVVPASAQNITTVGPNTPCTAFGTTSGTCIQGAGNAGTPSAINLSNGTGLPAQSSVASGATGATASAGDNSTKLATTGFSSTVNAPYWRIYLGSGSQTINGTYATLAFDTKDYDPSTVCSTVTHVCTPLVAGTYSITCSALFAATVGPPSVGGNIGEITIWKNGTNTSEVTVTAQVAGLASPSAFVLSNGLVRLNGTTDTIGCGVASDATTSPSVSGSGGITRTYMTGFRTGAQ